MSLNVGESSIDGSSFGLLDNEDLVSELKIASLLDRKKILNCMKGVRSLDCGYRKGKRTSALHKLPEGEGGTGRRKNRKTRKCRKSRKTGKTGKNRKKREKPGVGKISNSLSKDFFWL